MNRIQILCLQTNNTGRIMCDDILRRKGLIENVDYRILLFEQDIEKNLAQAGYNQLLIVGLPTGTIEDLDAIIKKARANNPQLVTVSFASNRILGTFDRILEKGEADSLQKFDAMIEDFIQGRLTR